MSNFDPMNKKPNKALTGIRGLDDVTNGGFPRARATMVAGGPGSGKTVLAQQTLVNGATKGEPGIFVAFEEDSARIVANAATFGWNLPELEKKDLFFLDAKPRPDIVCAGQFDLDGLLASLKIKANLWEQNELYSTPSMCFYLCSTIPWPSAASYFV